MKTWIRLNVLFFLCFLSNQIQCGDIIHYSGIPGCKCFQHCTCFHYDLEEECIFSDSKIADKIWHAFARRYLLADRKALIFMNEDCRNYWVTTRTKEYISLLGEYLNVIPVLEEKIEWKRIDLIGWFQKLYADNPEKLALRVDYENTRADEALQVLSEIPSVIIPLYKELLQECEHHLPYNMALSYNVGLIALLEGRAADSLDEITNFINLAKINNKDKIITSELFTKQGEAYLEVGLYHQAIESLSNALAKDPKNLEAYFQRAAAYFEIGDFEKSLEDFINSKKSKHLVPYNLPPNEFIDAFSQAAFSGAQDAVSDFIPSLCHTAYGLGECLWAFGEQPLDSVRNLASAGYEMTEHVVDYLKTVDKDKLHEYAKQVVQLYENFSQLSHQEKGELIGYTIGKYGVEILAGSAAIKGVSAFKKLKDANRICNLEAMAISVSNKEGVISKGLQQYAERCKFFENSKIHWGRQDKHIPGRNNYREGRSIFQHEDASKLLKANAGKGRPVRGEMGKPGYKEVVDFKEHIGVWKNENGVQLSTTKGTIHYSKDGAHIVPAHPKEKIW